MTVSPFRSNRRPLDRGALSGHQTHNNILHNQITLAFFKGLQKYENRLHWGITLTKTRILTIMSTVLGEVKVSFEKDRFVMNSDTPLS